MGQQNSSNKNRMASAATTTTTASASTAKTSNTAAAVDETTVAELRVLDGDAADESRKKHDELTTPLAWIEGVLEGSKPSKEAKRLVLLATGSFNPVHRDHMRMLITARTCLM